MQTSPNTILSSSCWVVTIVDFNGIEKKEYEKGYLQDEIIDRIFFADDQGSENVKLMQSFSNEIIHRKDTSEAYVKCYQSAKKGNKAAAIKAYEILPDNHTRLLYALDFWDNRATTKNFKVSWGLILYRVWIGGNNGSLLMQASITPALLLEMFHVADKNTLMNKEEIKILNELPESFDVWRGVSENAIFSWDGLSWTTNRKQALWFAYRNITKNESGQLLHRKISKKDVLALFQNENEIVINPHAINIIKINSEHIDCSNSFENLEALRIELKSPSAFPLRMENKR